MDYISNNTSFKQKHDHVEDCEATIFLCGTESVFTLDIGESSCTKHINKLDTFLRTKAVEDKFEYPDKEHTLNYGNIVMVHNCDSPPLYTSFILMV